MANVIVIAKIYVEDPEKIGEVEEEIKKAVDVKASASEELAFGIKILKVTFIANESEGMEKVEEKLKAISGISNIEIEGVDRELG